MHKILIYLHIIHLLKSSTCFEYYSAHLQEAYVVTVYMQPLVSSLSAGDCLVHRLRKNSVVEVLNVSVVFVEGDLTSRSGGRNAFPFVAVCCYLSLTGLFAGR